MLQNVFGQTFQQIGDNEHKITIKKLKQIGLAAQSYRDTVYNSDVISKSAIAAPRANVNILESALVIGFIQQSLPDPLAQIDHESSVSLLVKFKNGIHLGVLIVLELI